MSRFYGTLNAGRSTATKCGHAKDGLSACARGWDVGAELWIHADRTNAEVDAVVIEITAGTNGAGRRMHLATVTRDGAEYPITGGLLAGLLADAASVMVDLDHYASTHGEGPDHRRDALRASLLALGVKA